MKKSRKISVIAAAVAAAGAAAGIFAFKKKKSQASESKRTIFIHGENKELGEIGTPDGTEDGKADPTEKVNSENGSNSDEGEETEQNEKENLL